jgi:[acyl-carrier-protein] S-malonyltransferase
MAPRGGALSEQIGCELGGNELIGSSLDPDTDVAKGKTAWIFAGQGSQRPGMGRDIYDAFPEIRPLFASGACGFDLRELCFEAPASTLGDTRYTQAAMAVFSAAVIALLKAHGRTPDLVAGLSLGEYSALHAAGVFDADTLLNLLAYRGAIMAEAYTQPARMTAVFGLDDQAILTAIEQARIETGAVVACANFNCPGQVVISGAEKAVLRAEELLTVLGARRCIPLTTSGPFHTPLMEPAAELLRDRLSSLAFSAQQLPVAFNVTGSIAPDNEVKELLVRQISSPVLFARCLLTLRERGVDSIIEIGPGRVLAGFVKRTVPEVSVRSIDTVEDLKEVLEQGAGRWPVRPAAAGCIGPEAGAEQRVALVADERKSTGQ